MEFEAQRVASNLKQFFAEEGRHNLSSVLMYRFAGRDRSSIGTWNGIEKINMAMASCPDVLLTRTESKSVHLPHSGSKAGVVKRCFE